MRIFAYVSSMRKECSVTLGIINEIIDRLREICVVEESYIATPEKDRIELCNGCMGCLNIGKCVNDAQDQMEKLKKKMLSADLIILATPVYLHNVNAPMKNFLDRLNLWCYTMPLVGKLALPISVSSTNGNQQVNAYLTKILRFFGAGTLDALTIKNNLMSEEEKAESINSICLQINEYVNGHREFIVSKYQLEYYKQMKEMLNNIDAKSKLYQIWKEEKMLAVPDFQTLFNMKRKENDDNEKCRS